MKNKQFKFVYSFVDDEIPEAIYLRANNITNAKIEWNGLKKKDDVLLAIFCEEKEIWKNKEIKTTYNLEAIK